MEELEDEADAAVPQGAEPALVGARDRLAGHLDGAGLGPVEAAEHVQQRRLPGPRAPQHGDDLPGRDVEVGAVEHAPRRPALAERLHEPARADHRHRLHAYVRTRALSRGGRRRRVAPVQAPSEQELMQ